MTRQRSLRQRNSWASISRIRPEQQVLQIDRPVVAPEADVQGFAQGGCISENTYIGGCSAGLCFYG